MGHAKQVQVMVRPKPLTHPNAVKLTLPQSLIDNTGIYVLSYPYPATLLFLRKKKLLKTGTKGRIWVVSDAGCHYFLPRSSEGSNYMKCNKCRTERARISKEWEGIQ